MQFIDAWTPMHILWILRSIRSTRRKQIGISLLNYLFDDWNLKKIETAHLEVRRSNDAARNLYLKYGFEVAGVQKKYYSKEKEDAILMSISFRRD